MRLRRSKVNVENHYGDAYTVKYKKAINHSKAHLIKSIASPSYLIDTNIIANMRYLPSKGTTKLSDGESVKA